MSIDFDEGSLDREYNMVREDYKLYDIITNYFPPEPEAKGATIPLVFSGLLTFGLFVFIGSLYNNGANLSKLGGAGLLFLLNYLAIYGVIVAFWIEINLVNTLWILVGMTPVTLFTMHIGLREEDCEIQVEKKSKKE